MGCAKHQLWVGGPIVKSNYEVSGPRVALVGAGRYGVQTLRELLNDEVNVVTYISDEEQPTRITEITKAVADHTTTLSKLQEADTQFVLSAFNSIIFDEETIAAYVGRIANLHPSFLPAEKGADPITKQVQKRAMGAVTLHHVTAEIDGGPPIAQARYKVPGLNPTWHGYASQAIFRGVEMFKTYMARSQRK